MSIGDQTLSRVDTEMDPTIRTLKNPGIPVPEMVARNVTNGPMVAEHHPSAAGPSLETLFNC